MKFDFNLSEPNPNPKSPFSPSPKDNLEWLPLQSHPVFTTITTTTTTTSTASTTAEIDSSTTTCQMPKNLISWDGTSRLYFWDSNNCLLHQISIRLGEPEATSVIAASPSKVLRPDMEIKFTVNKIAVNGNGSALLLAGSDGLCVMYLYRRNSSTHSGITCRTIHIGSQIFMSGSSGLRILQVLWHPYSDTHLGILSSDSVFRLFDLSSATEQPEQEYYLQPVEPGSSQNATSICPVDFSFGRDHLWDRFSVFILFGDGSVYIICPVAPFGSVHKWEHILEIYADVHSFGLKSSNPIAVSNANMAICWLEATFPELAQQEKGEGNFIALKAHPYALFDASLSLQGPLHKVNQREDENLEVRVSQCEGCAVSFLYNSVCKDSILVTAWSGGQLQIDALADEIQPVWKIHSPPRLCVDSHDHILGLAMICESVSGAQHSIVRLDQPLGHTVWLGDPPPLLRLAVVDLALPRSIESGSCISMFIDPLIEERIFCLHDGGVDSVVLHFLPFTSQASGKDQAMRVPSVHPVLNTCQSQTASSPLCGFVALADSFGYSWVLGITSSQECIVLEMKTWNLLLPINVDVEKKPTGVEGQKETDTPDIISKELLVGPNPVLIPQASPNLRSISADSIEGRSTLHQYFKLFHENYVEYAHKVYFELKHHGPHMKKIIDEQHARLYEAQQKLLKVEEKQPNLEERINSAFERHNLLEERVNRLRNLPGAQNKPLSKAERDFKQEIETFAGVELDALHSSIEALNARLRRLLQSPRGYVSNQQKRIPGRSEQALDAHISHLKLSLSKLSLLNSENLKKAKLVESALRTQESGRR
ncbi:Nucleoporin Nup88 [Dillenia turbinata]|uniref:Nucleoporin Nup88 n=1 Tax=Dillenia turbinata TaxID=194707 RepID=A0AAN8VJU3_9MAGN